MKVSVDPLESADHTLRITVFYVFHVPVIRFLRSLLKISARDVSEMR